MRLFFRLRRGKYVPLLRLQKVTPFNRSALSSVTWWRFFVLADWEAELLGVNPKRR